jgi:hypothetical protein
MATTPMVADCHTTASSSSATETLKPWRNLVLERAHHLPPVLERLGVLDADFEGQLGDGHGGTEFPPPV